MFRLWEELRASRGVWLVLAGLALRIPDWGPSDRLPSLTLLFEVKGPKATSLATALRVGLVVHLSVPLLFSYCPSPAPLLPLPSHVLVVLVTRGFY